MPTPPARKSWWLSVPCTALLVLACQQIPLAEMDLGRHIANGRAVLAGDWRVLYINFHSAATPAFPTVNHHWLSGVFFAALHTAVSWPGLILIHAALMAAALYLALRGSATAPSQWPVALLPLPFLITRWQIRPEVFTLLGVAFLLNPPEWFTKRPWLAALLFALWVNLHLGFAIGLALLALATLTRRLGPPNSPWHLAAALAGTLANPNHIHGALAPLTIFGNYGYPIAENQPLWYWLPVLTGERPLFVLWALIVAYLLFNARRIPAYPLALAALGTALSLAMFRNLSLFGLLIVPALAALPIRRIHYAAAALALWATQTYWTGQGLTLEPAHAEALEWVRNNPPPGPLFNTFDNGSFLDLALPRAAWVDNRPEAYPAGFFESQLIVPMEDEAAWQRLNARRHFTTLVLSPNDQTAWGQAFLTRRLADPAWKITFENPALVVLRLVQP